MSDSSLHDEKDGDRRTFGPSSANKEILDLLVEAGHFRTSLGAFQAAAMVALREGLDPADAPTSAGTVWNRGSVNSQVLDFLTWYLPTSTPARALEQYGNLGLAFIAQKVRSGNYVFSELFELGDIDLE